MFMEIRITNGRKVVINIDQITRISKYEYLNPDKKSMSDLGGVSPDIVSYQIADSEMDVQLEAALDYAG